MTSLFELSCRSVAMLVLLAEFWGFLALTAPNMSDVTIGSLLSSRFAELERLPPQNISNVFAQLEAIKELRTKTPENALFLPFSEQAFDYYAGRNSVADLDPRMVEFYRASRLEDAIEALRKLGIQYIYIQSWRWPTIDKSYIRTIVSDKELATLIVDRFGYQVYKLNF